MKTTRHSIANALEDRFKRTFETADSIVLQVYEKVKPVAQGQINDAEAIQKVLEEVMPLLSEAIEASRRVQSSGEALLAHIREDEQIAKEFMAAFAADTTLAINLIDGFMANDANFVAHVLEVADKETLVKALRDLDRRRLAQIIKELD